MENKTKTHVLEINCSNPSFVRQAIMIAVDEYVNVSAQYEIRKRFFSRKKYQT